ncbi:MAG: MarR family transcriptional regulator [Candidatus Hadarchaeota archaeon]
MRLKTALPGVLLALLLVPAAGAQTQFQINWSDSGVEITDNSGKENIAMEYTILQQSENLGDTIEIWGPISGVSARDSTGALTHSDNISENWSKVTFYFRSGLTAGDRSAVTIEFTKAVTSAENGKSYTVGYRWSRAPLTSRTIAKLPRNSALLGTEVTPSSVYTYDGVLNVRWFKVLENSFKSWVTFEKSVTPPTENTPTSPIPTGGEVPISVLMAMVIVSLVLSGLIIYKARPPRQPVTVPEKQPASPEEVRKILSLLTDNERAVANQLLKQDDMAQKVLCEKTGIPKATMSRTIKSLEAKKIVRQTGHGAWKRVRLTRWAKQWKSD